MNIPNNPNIPIIEPSHQPCPQCGTIHPPLNPGETCPVLLARQKQETPQQPIRQPKKEVQIKVDNSPVDINSEIDHVIKGILNNIGIAATAKINELDLNNPKKVVALNKFRLNFEQRISDYVFSFLEEFKV